MKPLTEYLQHNGQFHRVMAVMRVDGKDMVHLEGVTIPVWVDPYGRQKDPPYEGAPHYEDRQALLFRNASLSAKVRELEKRIRDQDASFKASQEASVRLHRIHAIIHGQ